MFELMRRDPPICLVKNAPVTFGIKSLMLRPLPCSHHFVSVYNNKYVCHKCVLFAVTSSPQSRRIEIKIVTLFSIALISIKHLQREDIYGLVYIWF
jgi:hypothetical protein